MLADAPGAEFGREFDPTVAGGATLGAAFGCGNDSP